MSLGAVAALTTASPARADAPDDPWWGPDKALHLTAGFGLSAVAYAIGLLAFDDRWAATGLGGGVAIGLGAGKEGVDALGLGTPSWKDFTWTVVGAALGLGTSLTFDAALRGPE